jgi:hypothetical protein
MSIWESGAYHSAMAATKEPYLERCCDDAWKTEGDRRYQGCAHFQARQQPIFPIGSVNEKPLMSSEGAQSNIRKNVFQT